MESKTKVRRSQLLQQIAESYNVQSAKTIISLFIMSREVKRHSILAMFRHIVKYVYRRTYEVRQSETKKMISMSSTCPVHRQRVQEPENDISQWRLGEKFPTKWVGMDDDI